MKRDERGRYFKSEREYMNATGQSVSRNAPSIHYTGSVRGMRKLFWGYRCDVVRVGKYIYKAS